MKDIHYEIIGVVLLIVVIAFVLWRVKSAFELFRAVTEDTLKVYNDKEKRLKWSATKFTMAGAFFTALSMAIFDCINHGLNEIVFGSLLAVALGGKVTDAWSKKIDPTIVAPPTNENQN